MSNAYVRLDNLYTTSIDCQPLETHDNITSEHDAFAIWKENYHRDEVRVGCFTVDRRKMYLLNNYAHAIVEWLGDVTYMKTNDAFPSVPNGHMAAANGCVFVNETKAKINLYADSRPTPYELQGNDPTDIHSYTVLVNTNLDQIVGVDYTYKYWKGSSADLGTNRVWIITYDGNFDKYAILTSDKDSGYLYVSKPEH
jgi:hypothetical protein